MTISINKISRFLYNVVTFFAENKYILDMFDFYLFLIKKMEIKSILKWIDKHFVRWYNN